MTVDPQRHRFYALQQQEGIHRRQHRAHGALKYAAAAADERSRAIVIGVDQAVIRLVRLREHGVAGRIGGPGKSPAIDDDAAQRGAMAAHEFGQRMNHDIGAVIDRPHQHRRRHGIVDNQGYAMTMRNARQRLEIADVAGGVADRLAEYRTGVLVDERFNIRSAIGLREAHLHPHFRKDMCEQRVGGAVQLRHRHQVAARFQCIHRGVKKRSLSGRHAERAHAALEFGDPLFQHIGGRIGNARIAIAGHFQIEQCRAVLGAVEGIRRRLVDRHSDGFGRGVGVEASVNCNCFPLHARNFL